METYPCRLINKRFTAVMVRDWDGHEIERVLPGQEVVLEAVSEDALYGGVYEKVVWNDDGLIICTRRPDWAPKHNPSFPWALEIENIDGKELEVREVGGYNLSLPRGIAVPTAVSALDPLARYKRIEIRRVPDMFKSKMAGWWDFRSELRDVGIDRPANELEMLAEEIERLENKARQKPELCNE